MDEAHKREHKREEIIRIDVRGYERMVEEIKARLGADENPEILEEVAGYGAEAGWTGFAYTADCVEFYDAHKEAIWQSLEEDADFLGYDGPIDLVRSLNRSDMADTDSGFKNLLVLYTLEEVCRELAERGE
jgi:hypothetical protein